MPEINLPQPTKPDVFSFGFDKSLQRVSSAVKSPLIYDMIEDYLNTKQLVSGGELTLKNITLGGFSKMVSPGDDIQQAINEIIKEGGGTLLFKAGTHTVKKTLIGGSSIKFVGAKEDTTILSFEGLSNLSFTGTNVYTAGTVTSIASGVIVTGSGTLWLANVSTNHQFFIGNRWYKISAVGSDTSITLSEAYAGGATFPGASYRATRIIKDIDFEELSFKNSTGTALAITDARNVNQKNCTYEDNNKGFVYTNVSEFTLNNMLSVSNDSNGYELNNCGFADIEAMVAIINSGHGTVLNNIRAMSIQSSASNGNTLDGFNITDASVSSLLVVEVSSNGGQGIELVSGNESINFDNCLVNANTSDGIKFTGTSGTCKVYASTIKENGGYGINVAASTCDNNFLFKCHFNNNTSGPVNDSGTNTVYENDGSGAFSAVNGNNNNINVGEQRFTRITGPTAAFTITGISGTANAKLVHLYNSVAQNMTIGNENTSSTFTNRIITLTGADVATTGIGMATLQYNASDKSWILLGTQG